MSSKQYLTSQVNGTIVGNVARRAVMAGLTGILTLALVGCGTAQTDQVTTGATAADDTQATEQAADATDSTYYQTAATFTIDPTDLFSDRDLSGDYDTKTAVDVVLSDDGTKAGDGVSVDGSTVTITAEGTYVLSGELSDGRVVVDVDDTAKVQLVLNGAKLSSSTGTALYVRNADKVFVTLAKGSSNTVSATGASTDEDDHTLDGAVFASDDLTVNGEGSLEVASEQGSGIVGKDELTFAGGTLAVTAADHAIQAKDSLAVADGSYTLDAGTDGIHVAHDTNGEKGFAYFTGGTFTITAASDGIDASNDILVDGGTFTITADDDGMHSEYDLVVNDGKIDVTQCSEGLEGARYEQNGGDINIVASDDGINAVGDPDGAAGGEDSDFGGQGAPQGMSRDTTDDAQGSDRQQEGTDGQTQDGQRGPQGGAPDQNADRGTPPEGLEDGQMPQGGPQGQEGEPPAMPQGESGELADGQMPQGDGQMPQGGGMGGGMMDSDDTATLTINGGKLVVDASGDGLDSNGTLVVTGGETYVSGPTNEGNGAIDYGISASVTGGTLLATGSSGMAETFGTDSTQGSMLVSVSGGAGDTVELKDANGTVLASFVPTKQFTSIVATAPGVEAGSTYTVDVAGTSTEVTLDSVSYSNVQATMGSMPGGGMGGRCGMGGRNSAQGDQQTTEQDTATA